MNEDLIPRTSTEVAERIIALLVIIDKVFQGNDPELYDWVDDNAIKKYFSPEEQDFFSNPNPSKEAKINFSWKAEGLVSLFWAINLIDEMPPLNEEFNLNSIKKIDLIYKNPTRFKESVQLREVSELTNAEDYLYNAHWTVRDARLFEKEMPAELNPGIVYERRYAMSWLIGWGDNWDNVPTDT